MARDAETAREREVARAPRGCGPRRERAVLALFLPRASLSERPRTGPWHEERERRRVGRQGVEDRV